ncbi:MAG: methionine--tRNA ligase [Coriobacteriia bacterium]|nr:methionine--tRNA ligase [Coriobacteriia bacterium]
MSNESPRSYYLTTPIYYVNGVPHLGSAYTTIVADTLARAMRMDGRETFYLTGLDEHGQKVAQAATDQGMSPKDWVDSMAPAFKETWAALNVTNDDFIRTTEVRHMRGVRQLFNLLYEKGEIYHGTYSGYYCVPDETYFTEEQLAEFAEAREAEGLSSVDADGTPLCPDCIRPLIFMEEENLYFKLSKYTQPLLDFYEANPDFIQPEIRRNEVLSFVSGGLKDLSVSRTAIDWGVPIDFAPGHVSYVWIDALINYLTGVGYGSDDPADQQLLARFWPAQVHLIAKDIIRFHCVIWPALLMAADLPLPEQVFVHGYLLTKGQKMSKSRGNAMAPLALADLFSVDGYRYFFLADIQFGADSSISLQRMLQVYNADLANSWGNLCSRVFNMTDRYLGAEVPEIWPKTVAALTKEMGNPLAEQAAGLYATFIANIEQKNFQSAFKSVLDLVDSANLYLENSAPWALAKEAEAETAEAEAAGISLDDATAPTANDRLAFVLYNTLEAIRIAALFFAPVMPNTSGEVWRRLSLPDVNTVTDLAAAAAWGGLPAKNHVTIGDPLFPRLAEEDLDLEDE